ncbi:MAG: hypothetical protein ACPG8F_08880 [Flavobacteriaceae bacterium]
MKAQEYSDLITNFDPKSETHRKAFEKITYRYPYFQSAYAHYLKALKVQEQFNFDLILRKTAVLSPEREALHHWLERKEEIETANLQATKEEQTTQVLEQGNQEEQIKTEETKESNEKRHQENTTETGLKTKETVEVAKTQDKEKTKKKSAPKTMTYTDWVIYSSKGKIATKEKSNSLEEKIALIDSFLENKPKIPPVKQDQPKVDLSADNEFNKEELMTETLAKVYVQQKKFKKALYAYKILSLKYPEKNSFFADQIKKIKQLQQKPKS